MKKDQHGNIVRQPNFNKVAVLNAVIDKKGDESADIIAFFVDYCDNLRIQFLESIKTKQEKNRQNVVVASSGNRNDVFFAIHDDDLAKFASFAVLHKAVLIETVITTMKSKGQDLYPTRVEKYIIA